MVDSAKPPAAVPPTAVLTRIDVGEGSATAGLAAALDELEAACARQQAFGAVVDARSATATATATAADADADADADGPTPGRREQLRRLRRLRGELRQWCVGIAFVVASDDAVERQGKHLRAARLMLGCPVDTFSVLDEARAWLAARGARGARDAGDPGEARR